MGSIGNPQIAGKTMGPIIKLIVLTSLSGIFVAGCSSVTQFSVESNKAMPARTVPIDTDNDRATIKLAAMSLQQLRQDLGLHAQPLQPLDNISNAKLTDYFIESVDIIAKISKQPARVERSTSQVAIESNKLAQNIEDMFPQFNQVVRLRAMIQHYQTLAKQPWPALSEHKYALGQSHSEIAKIRLRLMLLGDLAPAKNTKYRQKIFDPVLIQSIKSFQQRHGIEATGELNTVTIGALNKTPLMRIKLMQQNLWRWLTLPHQLPSRYLWVNLPEYALKLYDQQKIVLEMPVIVGKPKSPTPVLITKLTRLTINPTWTPPRSIVKHELLPRHGKQPSFLSHQEFELHKGAARRPSIIQIPQTTESQLAKLLSEYRLVQAPGSKNALGKFRFTIPNTQTIYLHDTPTKHLFEHQQLALSHGCIRLKNADKLSRYLLATDKGKNSIRIRAAINSLATQTYNLSNPLPVFITYHTSWVDDHGKLQLRPDIYHLDNGIQPYVHTKK